MSPAATVLQGRKGRAVFARAEQVAPTDSSDEDWDPEDEDTDDEEGGMSNVGRGRVRLHAVQKQMSSALDDEEEQRKCLEKGWARRSVVDVRGVSGSGAANLEALPGREDFPAGADGEAEWAEALLVFEEANFEGAGNV